MRVVNVLSALASFVLILSISMVFTSLSNAYAQDEPVIATNLAQETGGVTNEIALQKDENGIYFGRAGIDGLAVAGVTFKTNNANAVTVKMRQFSTETQKWSEWETKEIEDGHGDNLPISGTDPVIINHTSQIEVSVSSRYEIGDPKLTILQSTPQNNGNALKPFSQTVQPQSGGLAIHPRGDWGADDGYVLANDAGLSGTAKYCRNYAGMNSSEYRGAIVHHTAGTNDYSQSEVPQIINSIFTYHARALGWGDIGYNFLVDKYGGVWEGKYGSIATNAVGFHAKPLANCSTMGISVLGNYDNAQTTPAMLESVSNVIRWKFTINGINPFGSAVIGTDRGWEALPTIIGHRDVSATTCPGKNLYSALNLIRTIVANNPYYQIFKSNTLFSDPERTIPLARNEISPGQEFYARVELYNAGSATWDANTRLATSNPRDRSSIFKTDEWLSPGRVMRASSTQTAAIGTFDFKMKAPSKVGVYKEYFSLVQEGYTWFNDLGQYFNIKVVNEATPERVANAKLLNGGSMLSGTVKESPKSLYFLAMQGDGNLVIYERPNNRVIWHSNSVRGVGSYTLANQGDGNIVIYKAGSGAIWDSHTARFGNATLSLQDDGNLVAYTNSYAQPSWSIFTGRLKTYESLGCSVAICLGIGETLGQNASKSASNGRAKLVMQGDGNLVLYSSSGKALWNSRTSGNPGAKAVNQGDGNLVVYAQDNRPLWASNTAGKGKSALMLQGDCNLVLYNSNGAIWNTGTFM